MLGIEVDVKVERPNDYVSLQHAELIKAFPIQVAWVILLCTSHHEEQHSKLSRPLLAFSPLYRRNPWNQRST